MQAIPISPFRFHSVRNAGIFTKTRNETTMTVSTTSNNQYMCIFHHTPIPGTSVRAVIIVSQYRPSEATFRCSELFSYQLSETG